MVKSIELILRAHWLITGARWLILAGLIVGTWFQAGTCPALLLGWLVSQHEAETAATRAGVLG